MVASQDQQEAEVAREGEGADRTQEASDTSPPCNVTFRLPIRACTTPSSLLRQQRQHSRRRCSRDPAALRRNPRVHGPPSSYVRILHHICEHRDTRRRSDETRSRRGRRHDLLETAPTRSRCKGLPGDCRCDTVPPPCKRVANRFRVRGRCLMFNTSPPRLRVSSASPLSRATAADHAVRT